MNKTAAENDHILEVKNLKTFFSQGKKTVRAVNGISFYLKKGEMLGIVGESGSGKSVTAKSIMGIIKPPGKVVDGEILYNGVDLAKVPKKKMKNYRGSDLAMIFQEPLSALNPSFSIGWQIEESYRLHGGDVTKEERKKKVIEMLEKVKIPDAERRAKEYPHQFSGGMRQRALIAIALACTPKILFADEPTTALDVTVQADIMDLLAELRRDMNLSIIFISHNFNLVAQRCERIMVMYAGTLVESATSKTLLEDAKHPYTNGLLNSIPDIDRPDQKLKAIPGDIADLTDDVKGCVFAPRCSFATERCFREKPELKPVGEEHYCACHLCDEGGESR